ncbi:50S ribosomal protein L5 [Patescibacteria group bacterium]|nr:50S ribosomal protein L5 [Patescibacteria group bacterium]
MNLEERFNKEISKKIKTDLNIKNPMALPKLLKIVVNMGVKDALADKKNIEKAGVILTQIVGQKPKIMKAKKSISTFKLRQGDQIALVTTLRGKRMYGFFEKITNIVLPRLRDFRGVRRTSFDGRGNYTLGFPESSVFPEIDPSKVDRIQGLEIVIVTTAKDDKQGLALLEALGMPFQKVN